MKSDTPMSSSYVIGAMAKAENFQPGFAVVDAEFFEVLFRSFSLVKGQANCGYDNQVQFKVAREGRQRIVHKSFADTGRQIYD